MKKYNSEKHHRRSIRLKGYDYSQSGMYFITICTQNRWHLFGEIDNTKMILNKYGEIANNEWLKTAIMRNDVELLEYVIMPNHIHGIIEITVMKHRDHAQIEKFAKPTSNTIPTIIRGYKSTVTKQINIIKNVSGGHIWQRNYWEHIIRNEKEFMRISQYINDNPINWHADKLNNDNNRVKESLSVYGDEIWMV